MSPIGAQGASPFLGASEQNAGYDLEDVEVVLFSPLQNTRRSIRDAVHGAGFRRVDVVTTIEKLRQVLRNTEFDMLVLEAKGHLKAVCEHIQDIRHGRLGSNPFLVINVITWKPSDDVIRTFIDAGADDIIVMPISISAVTNRVDNIIANRKKFVATERYLGPDRRNLGRDDEPDLVSFEVPNGVRFKATGDESARVDLEKIERANSIVVEHRLRRTTLQFGSFATTMERFINENPDRIIPADELSEISDMARYIARQTENDSRPEIRELVKSLQNVMGEAIFDGRSEANLFALLRVHGEALLALLRGEGEAADLVVRAVLTASEIIDKRVHKRKQTAEAETGG